ncbi:MAG: outer membrane beta-barrel family protein, partial [Saprospiraceae bacterium]
MFEAGAIYDDRRLKNLQNVQINTGPIVHSPFHYNEKTYAVYTMAKRDFNKLSIQAGLRYEYLKSSSDGDGEEYDNTRTFSDLFPSLHLSYKINDKHQVNAGYSRRISRPNFGHLKPVSSNSSLSTYVGNPNLRPEYGHNMELTYQLQEEKWSFSGTAFFRKKLDIIDRTYELNGTTQITSYANLGKSDAYGIETMVKIFPYDFWTATLNANYYGGVLETSQFIQFPNSKSSNFNIKNSFDVWKNISTDLNCRIRGKSTQANYVYESYTKLDWAISSKFFKKRLSLTFNVFDILNNAVRSSTKYGEDYTEEYNYRSGGQNSRTFGLSASYKLANAKT